MSAKPFAILGGGLWGGLLALRLQELRPELTFKIFEQDSGFGGKHTWSFHGPDVGENLQWLEPMVTKSWAGYDVIFPEHQRGFDSSYHSITSEKFNAYLKSTLKLETFVLSARVTIEDLLSEYSFVIDARGLYAPVKSGLQNFIGWDVELTRPHGLERPILKDVSVKQIDGYRFIYYLPWTPTRVLIEDTRYTLKPKLEENILDVIKAKGWEIKEVLSKEEGSLPLPMEPVIVEDRAGVISLAGIFHDTTGYSLPDAVRLTNKLCELKTWTASSVSEVVSEYRKSREGDRSFFRLLNRLLFEAAPDHERFVVLQYFYRRPKDLIEKFYSGQMNAIDRVRVFLGKPPVRITRALKTFLGRSSC
jgi:lycopene beta-cyclase